jgi:hypothetical protein
MSQQTTNLQQGLDVDWQRRFAEVFRPPEIGSNGLWDKIKRNSTQQIKFEFIDEPLLANKWFNFQKISAPNSLVEKKDSTKNEPKEDTEGDETACDKDLFEAVDPEDSRYKFWLNGGQLNPKDELSPWVYEGSNHSRRLTTPKESAKSPVKQLSQEKSNDPRSNHKEGSNLTFSYFVDEVRTPEFSPIDHEKHRPLTSQRKRESSLAIYDSETTKSKEECEDSLLSKRINSSASMQCIPATKHISC